MLFLRSDLDFVGGNALGGGGHGRFLDGNLLTKPFNFTFDTFPALKKVGKRNKLGIQHFSRMSTDIFQK